MAATLSFLAFRTAARATAASSAAPTPEARAASFTSSMLSATSMNSTVHSDATTLLAAASTHVSSFASANASISRSSTYISVTLGTSRGEPRVSEDEAPPAFVADAPTRTRERARSSLARRSRREDARAKMC